MSLLPREKEKEIHNQPCKYLVRDGRYIGITIPLEVIKTGIGFIPEPWSLYEDMNLQHALGVIAVLNITKQRLNGKAAVINLTPETRPLMEPKRGYCGEFWRWRSANIGSYDEYEDDTHPVFYEDPWVMDFDPMKRAEDTPTPEIIQQEPKYYAPDSEFYIWWGYKDPKTGELIT